MSDSNRSDNTDDGDTGGRSAAEWVTFGASCVILLAVLTLIVVQVLDSQDPPAPAATLAGGVREVGDQYHVSVVVDNAGDRTAANVQVTAELTVDATTTSGDQTIDFLAGGEAADLVFVFDDDPAGGELTVTVTGYTKP